MNAELERETKRWQKRWQFAESQKSVGNMGRYYSIMDEQIQYSSDDGIEYGFSVCGDEVYRCIGNSCQIVLSKCHDEQKFNGEFHTHPTGNINFSIKDILVAFKNRRDVMCVGGRNEIDIDGIPGEYHGVKCMAVDRSHPNYDKTRMFLITDYWLRIKPVHDTLYSKMAEGADYSEELAVYERYRTDLYDVMHKNDLIWELPPIDNFKSMSIRIVDTLGKKEFFREFKEALRD